MIYKILILLIVLQIFLFRVLELPPIKIIGRWSTWPAKGRVLGPFIMYATKQDSESEHLVEHEMIHWEQQKELYFVGWWVLYSGYFVHGLIKYAIKGPVGFKYYRSTGGRGAYWHAYKNNPFEVEASKGELAKRDAFDWMDYL